MVKIPLTTYHSTIQIVFSRVTSSATGRPISLVINRTETGCVGFLDRLTSRRFQLNLGLALAFGRSAPSISLNTLLDGIAHIHLLSTFNRQLKQNG